MARHFLAMMKWMAWIYLDKDVGSLVIGPELQNIGVVEGAVFLLASQIQ
jgi:hypothetical protein